MVIDNFDLIRSKLTFESQFDRYIIHIIKRAKDDKGRLFGVNETNRMLKTFYITSTEYFDKKRPVIETLCKDNIARAYILPQVRNNSDCLRNLLKLTVNNLDNPTQKPDHLIRSAYCGYHGSRDAKWIIDIDSEFMPFVNTIRDAIIKNLNEIGKSESDLYFVPTKNGCHIVTSPFNSQAVRQEIAVLFSGEQYGFDIDLCKEWLIAHDLERYCDAISILNPFDVVVELTDMFLEDESITEENYKRLIDSLYTDITLSKKYNGLLIKDGMTLLFFDDGNNG